MDDKFIKDRDAQLEVCADLYFNGELGSCYYDGSLRMANWAYDWCKKYQKIYLIGKNDYQVMVEQLTAEADALADALEIASGYNHDSGKDNSMCMLCNTVTTALTRYRKYKDGDDGKD